MQLKMVALTMTLILVAAAFGTTAFTSGTVERSANVNVVNDDTGLLALADGTSGPLVYQNSSGALEIDFTKGGAGGVNAESHYELGDPANPVSENAFTLSNLDAESHDIALSYTGADAGDADANIKFRVFESGGTEVATVSEESTSATISGAASGSTYYAVIVVDTHGVSSSTDLSGTLKVSA